MDRAEEVWRDAFVAWDNGWRDDQAAVSVIRTAMEAYAAEKVAEERAAIVAWLRGDNGFDNEDGLLIADAIAANQHHGGNDG